MTDGGASRSSTPRKRPSFDERDYKFALCFAVADDVSRESVCVRDEDGGFGRHGLPANSATAFDPRAGGLSLKRAQEERTLMFKVESDPVQIGSEETDHRYEVCEIRYQRHVFFQVADEGFEKQSLSLIAFEPAQICFVHHITGIIIKEGIHILKIM